MKFSTEFNIPDIALGLSAVVSLAETDASRLADIQRTLAVESHETIFDRAQEIAAEYGGAMRIEEIAHTDMENVDCFAIAQTPVGWVCALWGGPDGPIMPQEHALIAYKCPPPETWIVFRAYPFTVN